MKKNFNVRQVVAEVLKGRDDALPAKAANSELRAMVLQLAGIARRAHVRAKQARCELVEQRRWQAAHTSLSAEYDRLQRIIENLQDNNRALEEQSARYARMGEEVADAYVKEVAGLNEQITHTTKVANAAIAKGNALLLQLDIERQVSDSNIELAQLGVLFTDDTDDES